MNMAGEIFGVLSIHFSEPRRPTRRDMQMGDLCAQMASVLAERESVRREALTLSRKAEVALGSSAVPFSLWKPVRNAQGAVEDFVYEYLNVAAARKAATRFKSAALSDIHGHRVSEAFPGVWDAPGSLDRM